MKYSEYITNPTLMNEVAHELCRLWSIDVLDQKEWAMNRLRKFHTHCGVDCQQAIQNVHARRCNL